MDSRFDLSGLKPEAIDAEFCARFRQGVLDAWPGVGPLGLAVSGGADSMAMLLLAHRSLAHGFEVATVDHGLRAEAVDECNLVVRTCQALEIPCSVLSVSLAEGNLQEQARIARYRTLGEWAQKRGLSAISTAHHADDQAETVMMRLNRGSGLAGLSGIRNCTHIDGCAVPVVRPLLRFRRAELRQVLADAGAAHAEDPSNADISFDRVLMRKALSRAEWIDPSAIAQSAHYLAEAERTLQSFADAYWRDHAQVGEKEVRVGHTEWAEVNARLLTRAMGHFGGSPDRGELAALLDKLDRPGARSNLAGVLVTRRESEFVVTREPPRRAG